MPKPTKSTPKVTVSSIDKLTQDPANLRRHPDRNIEATDASLKRFGPARSIVIDADDVVRAGNRTVASAIAAGYKEVLIVDPEPGQLVAVRRNDWTASEATAYGIADNRTSDLSEFIEIDLAETLRSLQSEDFDLEAVGFTGDEVDKLLEGLANDALDGTDDREIPESNVRTGQYGVIVMCTDEASQSEAYDRLTGIGYECKVVCV